MHLLVAVAMSQLGKPYIWGGENPQVGFDCSGFAQWVLRSVGEDPPGDQTAQGLYNHFEKIGDWGNYTAGALAFYGSDSTKVPSARFISHVAILIDQYRVIEAGGGGSHNKTFQDACENGACVRVRPIKYRNDLVAVIKPKYIKIGML